MAHFKDEGSIGAPDSLILGGYKSRVVTIASGSGVLKRGTVLGTITVSKKATISLAAASDGSQTPDAILGEDVDATSADVRAVVYFHADEVDQDKLILGAGHTLGSVDTVFRKQGIWLVKPMG